MTIPTIDHIHWSGHDCFRIDADGLTIYIDPLQLGTHPSPADLILITHDHYDHFSMENITKIQKKDTVFVTTTDVAAKLMGDVKTIRPGQKLTIKGILVEAVPAYNINKFRSPGVPFHPKEKQNVGFIIEVKGQRIYHAGDTDHIPEMAGMKVDIALLPVSGTYVMTFEEAVVAARAIQPKVAIPMHVGADIGTLEMAKKFKEQAGIPVVILKMEK